MTQISLIQLHWPTHKPLFWCKNRICISITSWLIANFPLKFANFCYHGNKGQSGRRLNAQHNWPNPKIPCKNLGPMINASCVMANLVWKFPNLRYHGNRGWSGTNFSFTVTAVQSINVLNINRNAYLHDLIAGMFVVVCCAFFRLLLKNAITLWARNYFSPR